jgi:hypothetical protein
MSHPFRPLLVIMYSKVAIVSGMNGDDEQTRTHDYSLKERRWRVIFQVEMMNDHLNSQGNYLIDLMKNSFHHLSRFMKR